MRKELDFEAFYNALSDNGTVPIYVEEWTLKIKKFVRNRACLWKSKVYVEADADLDYYPTEASWLKAVYSYSGEILEPWVDGFDGRSAEAVFQEFTKEKLAQEKEREMNHQTE